MSTFVQPFQISQDFNELLAEEAAAKANLQNIGSRKKEERSHFAPQMRGLIAMFNFTEDELFPKPEKKVASVDKDYSPDYFFRDPGTGEEWDGKGKRPAYLSGKKKTNNFRIYHATGTRFAPVVNPNLAQPELATARVGDQSASENTVAPVAPVALSAPIAEPPGIASAITAQPAASPIALTGDHSASAFEPNASARVVAIPS